MQGVFSQKLFMSFFWKKLNGFFDVKGRLRAVLFKWVLPANQTPFWHFLFYLTIQIYTVFLCMTSSILASVYLLFFYCFNFLNAPLMWDILFIITQSRYCCVRDKKTCPFLMKSRVKRLKMCSDWLSQRFPVFHWLD